MAKAANGTEQMGGGVRVDGETIEVWPKGKSKNYMERTMEDERNSTATIRNGTKRCTACGRELPLTSFYNVKKGRDGKHSRCGSCEQRRLKDYRRDHPGANAIYLLRYRLKLQGKPKGTPLITLSEWNDLCAKHDNRCAACGIQGTLQIDHIIPGGPSTVDNIQPLCSSCNQSKGQREKPSFYE